MVYIGQSFENSSFENLETSVTILSIHILIKEHEKPD